MNSSRKSSGEEFSATVPVKLEEGDIGRMIYTVRGVQVMLDRDLAGLYQVTTGNLNKAVKRNVDRFPDRFMFQLTTEEWEDLKSHDGNSTLKFQNGTSSWGGVRKLPYVFTEQGVSQLSAVLRSNVAVDMSTRIDRILDCMENGTLKARLGIFFEGQMFDAFVLVETLFKRAIRRIVLIDDYVSGDILQRMRVRPGLSATIDCYVRDIHRIGEMEQAFRAYNAQYPDEHCQLHTFNEAHDRWTIDGCPSFRVH